MTQTHSLDLERSSTQFASVGDDAVFDLGSTFTIEAWIKLESLPGTGEERAIVGKWQTSGNNRSYVVRIRNISGSNYLELVTDSNGSAGGASVYTTAALDLEIDVWYHVAFINNSGSGIIYLDGKSVGSSGSVSTPYNGSADLVVGAERDDGTAGWDGKIKDVRIFDDVRTQAEVVEDARTENVSDGNLEAEWNLNNNYTDDSGNGNDLTASGSPVFSTDIPWEEAAQINGSTYLDANIEWYSDMEDLTTSTIEDLVGSLDGTKEAANQPLEATGKIDNCQSFTTGGDLIDFSFNPRTTIGTGDFTISLWVKMPTNSNRRIFIYFGDSGDVNFYDAFTIQAGNSGGDGSDINVAARDGTTGYVEISDGGGNQDDAWHHLVAVRDGTTLSFYIDGILVNRTTDTEWGVDVGALARIGAGQADGNPMRDGEIDELGIWSRAMHYGDVLDLYNEGTGIPYSSGVAYTQDVDETLTLGDSIAKEANKVLDETVTLAVTITRDIQKAFTETVTLVASITNNLITNKQITESITLTASEIVKITGKTFTDTVTLVANLSLVRAFQRAFTDTVTLVASSTIVRTFNRTFTDSISLVSSIANVLSLGRIFTDSIGLEDRLYGLLNGVNMKYIDQYNDEVGEYVDQYFDI